MPGNSRRSSMPADSSPSCSKAVRIAAASASDTQNTAQYGHIPRQAHYQLMPFKG